MTTTTRHRLILATLPFTLLFTGCLGGLFGTGENTAPPVVGVYKSIDKGTTWTRKNDVLAIGDARPNLNSTNVVSFIFDPTDRDTLYLGTEGRGLYISTNGADSWLPSRGIRAGTVQSIALANDPLKRCSIFISSGNEIYRSRDCGRFWDEVYTDTRANVIIRSLAVHVKRAETVYAGTSQGDVLRSEDGGATWQTIGRVGDEITRIIPHTLNENILYVTLKKKGVQITEDGGATWTDLSAGLKEFKSAATITDADIDPARPETMILASDYGLVRTTDAGKTWSAIPLITPPNKAPIVSVALNPKNPEELYYATSSTLYRSADAGKTWETKTLPVVGPKVNILIDPQKPDTIYLGTYQTPQ